jgi:hypothetical protein
MRERGQALIETLLLGLILMAPLLWGLGVLADLHRAALATSAAAREAGFEAARSIDPLGARSLANDAVFAALRDNGLDPSKARVDWSIGRLERGAPIEVVISYPVPVFQAPFIGQVSGPAIWTHAKSVARIDRYRSRS